MQQTFYVHNGQLIPANDNSLSFNNRSFKYGLGVFETMRVVNGQIPLLDAHYSRLKNSLKELFNLRVPFNKARLLSDIQLLAEASNCYNSCMTRLTVYNGNGPLTSANTQAGYIIEIQPIPFFKASGIQQSFKLIVFDKAYKAAGNIYCHKTTNYLLYYTAMEEARKNKAGDAIILNAAGKVTETAIANIFYVKKGKLYTPALSTGCLPGIMRQLLIQKLIKEGYNCMETEFTIARLLLADEIFLTNAVKGIIPVTQIGNISFNTHFSQHLIQQWVSPFWNKTR